MEVEFPHGAGSSWVVTIASAIQLFPTFLQRPQYLFARGARKSGDLRRR
jgi:hypothetical protein